MLADRLLAKTDYDCDRELRTLELLKARGGLGCAAALCTHAFLHFVVFHACTWDLHQTMGCFLHKAAASAGHHGVHPHKPPLPTRVRTHACAFAQVRFGEASLHNAEIMLKV